MSRQSYHTRRNRDDPKTDRASTTMSEVSHTHPYGDQGAINRPFQRGPVVAADGGRRDAREEDEEDETDGTRMKDIDHTPPVGDGVDRVFERGNEQTDPDADESPAAEHGEAEEPVVSEE